MSSIIESCKLIREHKAEIIALQDLPTTQTQVFKQLCSQIAPNHTLVIQDSYFSGEIEYIRSHSNCLLIDEQIRIIENSIKAIEHRQENQDESNLNANNRTTMNHDNHIRGGQVQILGITLLIPQNRITQPNSSGLNDATTLTIFNLYIRPRASSEQIERGANFIKGYAKILNNCHNGANPFKAAGNSRTIIVGDVNAWSPQWAPTVHTNLRTSRDNKEQENGGTRYFDIKLNRGRQIDKLIRDMKLTCANQIKEGPTFKYLGRESYIDIALVGNKLIKKLNNFSLFRIGNGVAHRAIVLSFGGIGSRNEQINGKTNENDCIQVERTKTNAKLKIDYDSISEGHFTALKLVSSKLITNWHNLPRDRIISRMNRAAEHLYKTLKETQDSVTKALKPDLRTSQRNQATHHSNINLNTYHGGKLVRSMIYKLKRYETRLRDINNQLRQQRHNSKASNKSHHIQAQRSHGSSDKKIERLRKQKRTMKLKLDKAKQRITKLITMANWEYNHSPANNQQHNERELWRIVRKTLETNQEAAPSYTAQRFEATEPLDNHLERLNTYEDNPAIRHTDDSMEEDEDEDEERDQTEIGNESTIMNATTTNLEQLEQLADAKFPFISRPTNLTNMIADHLDLGIAKPIKINENEFEYALKQLTKKTYTSPQGIKFRTFVKAVPFIKPLLYQLCSMTFETIEIPKVCQLTTGTLIPKPKAPTNFRIVHVSSPLTSLIEQIALYRLEYQLELNRLYSRQQFGFMPNRGRHDLISRVLEIACRHRLKMGSAKNALIKIVSLDISGAFDNVEQGKLAEKLVQYLKPDNIGYWLAQFMLNRQIEVKLGNVRSKPRLVCKGVPQGSALGPILWNFAINDLGIGLSDIEGSGFEILKYADDIILVYTGTDMGQLQSRLNMIIGKLKEAQLRVNPEKCAYMNAGIGSQPKDGQIAINELRIDNRIIPTVEKLCILGVTITNKLTLEINSSNELAQKIASNTDKLYRINQFNIINDAKEWRTLIESLLTSVIIYNTAPVLAIDRMALKWADKQMTRSLRIIFGWPSNASDKAIRLICGIVPAKELVRKQLTKRLGTEHTDSYETLLRIMRGGFNTKIENILQVVNRDKIIFNRGLYNQSHDKIRDLKANMMHMRRRFHNPEMTLTIKPRRIDLKDTSQGLGPIWVMTESASYATISQILELDILETFRGYHNNYKTSYFNGLSLLLNHTQSKAVHNRRLALSETNGLYQALLNINNHDWRVIELRESIVRNEWEVVILNDNDMKLIKHILSLVVNETVASSDTNRQSNTPNRNDEQSGTEGLTLEEIILRNKRTCNLHPIQQLSYPDLSDYWHLNASNKEHRDRIQLEFNQSHTSLTKILNSDHRSWQQIPPNWISSRAILMLSGLVTNEKGTLVKGTRGIENHERSCCQQNGLDNSSSSNNTGRWNHYESETVTHRAFYCKRIPEERQQLIREIIDAANNRGRTASVNANDGTGGRNQRRDDQTISLIDPASLRRTIEHRFMCQKLIRALTNLAFDH